jgi:DNA mismatch repair protein MutL
MNTYILCTHQDELVIVDQHAAHERILYERRASYFDEAHGSLLLFPETIKLSPQLVQHLLTVQKFFGNQGIHFDALGDNEIAVRSAPPQLRGPSLTTVLTDAAHFIEEHGTLDRAAFTSKFNEHVHSHMACKAAVKAGDQLTQQAMGQLINDLMAVANRFICVHGRPTLWSIGNQEIEKKFRRR